MFRRYMYDVLWEEKHYIEPNMNSENKNESETNVITNVIVTTSVKDECEDTGKWTKNCPECGKEQVYSSWNSLRNSIRRNTICNPCRASKYKIIPDNGVWKRVCQCWTELIYSCRRAFNTGKRSNAICRKCATKESAKYADKSIFQTSDYKQKMSGVLKMSRNSDRYGEEFKQKCRENKLRQIQQQGVQRTYNPHACAFMDNIGKKFGWNLRHAMNGGEVNVVGYSLDGYDSKKNIVFEYDEPKHRILTNAKKDKEREKRIVAALHPSAFFRYDVKDNRLIEIIDKKEIIWQ